jgi:hypothetical protein
MIRCDSFPRAAAFAALAAGGGLAWEVVAAPWLGARVALTGYLVLVTALYVFALVPRRGRRIVAALAAASAGVMWAAHAQNVVTLTIGLGVIIAVARGTMRNRASPPRALATELMLGATALLFAGAVAGPTLLSVAVALWAYLLVQGCFFLLPSIDGEIVVRHRDPFEEAHGRAIALLGGEPRS